MCTAENIIWDGNERTVEYAIRDDGTMPAKVFIESLPLATRVRFRAMFEHIADGTERAISHAMFCQEQGDIHAFRCKLERRHIRLPCFRLDDRWIITHGFIKPGKSAWNEQEFKLATEIMNEVKARG